MFFRTSSSWKIVNSFSSNVHRSLLTKSYFNTQLLIPTSNLIESQRTFLFWRSNIERELYGTPRKAEITRRSRRLQKTFRELIRDGQFWRFVKESFLPEWKKLWKEMRLFDRRSN